VLGASATSVNFGRIILDNVIDCGFPRERVCVVKRGVDELLGVRCVPTISLLPERTDLLVISAPAPQLPALAKECVESERVESAILITGGVGEIGGGASIAAEVKAEIAAGRERPDGGPIFLGPNSLGVLSRPGRYDTLFIPREKVDKGWSARPRRVALLSQSGAFIVSRLSNLETLNPALAVSIGNQIDLTPSDFLRVAGARDDVDVIGAYVEGFRDLDGLEFLRAIAEVRRAGKEVVFYKAGRSEPGRSAAAGHTASVAGDYDVCQAAAAQAGALVADTFREFEQLLELCTALHGRAVHGARMGLISNAGYETVGMADAVQGQRYRVSIAALDATARGELERSLQRRGLAGLVAATNPLDLTPQADEDAYEDAIRCFLACGDVDAVVAGIVPLTSQLLTLESEIADPRSLAHRLPALFAAAEKPLIAVVDSGSLYEPLVRALRSGGVPVFRSADQAMRSIGRYLCHRAESAESASAPALAAV
jgi:acyl-CoA synthetase (NDP forming)